MGLVNNKSSEYEQYIDEQEKLVGLIRVTGARMYGYGYDDAVEDCQDRINMLENERELLEITVHEQEEKLRQVGSHLGAGLSKLR
ncbi:hypothetical protein [Vibrio sp. OPT46]|uniref:hypothetical protein n=1 Tax=Vibrio sp. OPT46 TaxID=2778645 RepID=UPI001882C888|nr:hypothetical protein [Vibrio sp. OPT46]MBE8571810.1 hypothetical protein [Vibrio sp. OPT46]